MVELNRLIFVLMISFTVSGDCIAQNNNSEIVGKWKSIRSYQNNSMEIFFSKSDSLYTEVVRNTKSKKIVSTYKVNFRILDDSTIILKAKAGDEYIRISIEGKKSLKFYQFDKKIKEDIPLRYVFKFQRVS